MSWLAQQLLPVAQANNFDFITGEKFVGVATTYSAPAYGEPFDPRKIMTRFDLNQTFDSLIDEPLMVPPKILYCHIHHLNEFNSLIKKVCSDRILITHNEDWPATEEKLASLNPAIKRWFSTNMHASGGRVQGIPIGLPNSYWTPHGQLGHIQSKMGDLSKKTELLFNCINPNTNPAGRYSCMTALQNLGTVWGRLEYHDYINQMHKCLFVASPRGNGVDCHRTWEALYLGCIPIVERSVPMSYFEDLPILFVDSYAEVTKELLEDTFLEFRKREWNLEALWMPYWRNKICNSLLE